jgi:hypothetical protein
MEIPILYSLLAIRHSLPCETNGFPDGYPPDLAPGGENNG